MFVDVPVKTYEQLISKATEFLHLLGLPWIANPHIFGGQRCVVIFLHHVLGQLALLGLVLVLLRISKTIHNPRKGQRTWSTKTKKLVFSLSRPNCFCAVSTSFWSSLTAYSSVVRVSSTSSTMRMSFPIRLFISNELRSSHCVRVTLVPGTSSGSPRPKSS